MNRVNLVLYILIFFTPSVIYASLSVDIIRSKNGLKLYSIKHNGMELLNPKSDTPLFKIRLKDTKSGKPYDLISSSGWQELSTKVISNTKRTITLKRPINKLLPRELEATITLSVDGDNSIWDLKVSGLKNYSIYNVSFPNFSIKTFSDDHLFVPYRFGKVIDNPSSNLDYGENSPNNDFINGNAGLYPMGWGAVMQYMAYYNSNYGIYFGAQDPKASIKTLIAKSSDGGILVGTKVPAPDMSKSGNDFDYPGSFRVQIFNGDWYDASMIYKIWVKRYAEYYPKDSSTRRARYKKLASIDIWGAQTLWNEAKYQNYSTNVIYKMFCDFKDYLGDRVTLGAYWLGACNRINEDDFPQFYPSKTAIDLNKKLKAKYGDKVELSIYTNGYLYDLDIANPDRDVPPFKSVKKYAIKKESGDIYTQKWAGNEFAIMCPTQKRWQDILANVHKKHLSNIGIDGVLIDQITASTPRLCMDKRHNHPLGGGHYHRDGYKKLLEKIHQAYPKDRYFITEAFNDSLLDEVVGYETIKYETQGQVPAIQAVYSGLVQFIGPKSGTDSYQNRDIPDSPTLYSRSGEAFVFGSTLGYFYPDIVQNITKNSNTQRSRAAMFIKKLAIFRDKLKNYLAFGEMKKPLKLIGKIPKITIPASPKSWMPKVTRSAIEHSVWLSKDKKSVALIFVNTQTPDKHNKAIKFDITFDPKKYGLNTKVKIVQMNEFGLNSLGMVKGHFKTSIKLYPAQVKVIVVESI